MERIAYRTAIAAVLATKFLSLLSSAALSQEAATSAAPGVNPKDNITKTELIYRYDHLDLGDYTQSLTVKYDRAFNARWGGNIEIPTVAFSGFGVEEIGLGDIQVRLRYNAQAGSASVILGGELVLPTATDDTLGRGKYQLNPVVGAVLPLSQSSFLFIGYKHLFSFAGDEDRPNINESQPRILAGYTSQAGWWLLGDLKFTHSWENKTEQLDFDAELGRMIGPTTGVWTRVGTSLLDSDRDASILFGIRFIR